MSLKSTGQESSPAKRRLQAPLPPSPHRTTSQLSVVSVKAHSKSDDQRVLLSSTLRSRSSSAPQVPKSRPNLASTSSSSSSGAAGSKVSIGSGTEEVTLGDGNDPEVSKSTPISRASTPSQGLRVSSRKGKERAVEVLGESVERGDVASGQWGDDAARGLRKLVRRGTIGRPSTIGSRTSTTDEEIRIENTTEVVKPPDRASRGFAKRRYFVLTHAGKPVFTSTDESDDNLTNLMGVAQALISIFAEDDDKLRCIVKGRHKISFVLKSPLYLFCVSDWGEPEHVLRVHLEYIHLQILSVVSSTQLSRVFQRRSNFDLSRLLEGTEIFLHALIDRCQTDFSYLTASLTPLRMAPALRDTAAAALMPPAKFKDLLYVLLIAGGHIVTLLRPRKHSIHPSDLHLLHNTLQTSSTLRSSESWLPMCFPKFNPAGFVHAYISYVLHDVGLVFVSADREAFEDLQGWKGIVLEKLEKDGTLLKIQQSIPHHAYPVSAVACPGLRHFIYKSRQHVQITSPTWEGLYAEDGDDRRRLVTMYQHLHDAVHARSGQTAPLRLVYIRSDQEAVMAWITKPFELYLAVSPQMAKAGIVGVANNIARWIGSEESRLFLKDAPVF